MLDKFESDINQRQHSGSLLKFGKVNERKERERERVRKRYFIELNLSNLLNPVCVISDKV